MTDPWSRWPNRREAEQQFVDGASVRHQALHCPKAASGRPRGTFPVVFLISTLLALGMVPALCSHVVCGGKPAAVPLVRKRRWAPAVQCGV